METEPHLKALTQHLAGSLAVPGVSAAADIKLLMNSGSGTTAMSQKLLEALQGQPGMTQSALTQACVGNARALTSLDPECQFETLLCPLHFMIETPWGPVWFTIYADYHAPWESDVVIIGQKLLREKLGIDIKVQLKAAVLKAHGCHDNARKVCSS